MLNKKHFLQYKIPLQNIIKILAIVFCIWFARSLFFTIIRYQTLLSSINLSTDTDDYFSPEYSIKEHENVKITTLAKKQKGSALSFYSNGNSKMELTCQAYPISFFKLLYHKFMMTSEYKIHMMDYQCERIQYYDNGTKMLVVKYTKYTNLAYEQDILKFLKEESFHFYKNINDIGQLCIYKGARIIGHSISYYPEVPDQIKDLDPNRYDICLPETGFLYQREDENLCRMEEYQKYKNGSLLVKEYYTTGSIKREILYKDKYKDQIIKGKIFDKNGDLSIKYETIGNNLKELHYDLNKKLYKEVNYYKYKINNIKLYSYSGDLKYILYFKNNKPDYGFKYEDGNELPLTNAHIYNIFNIKQMVK